MEPDAAESAWWLAGSGIVCFLLGLALLVRPAWLSAVGRRLGSGDASARERWLVPAVLLVAGTGWLFTAWAAAYQFFNNQRPPAVVLLSVLLPPLGGLLVAGLLLWFVLLRRR